ncbi:MAG: TfoX/Sxy family protein [Spirochaetia bacterium]|nr:TfoX/Sxy family protein [Spirochaetia bacterium]
MKKKNSKSKNGSSKKGKLAAGKSPVKRKSKLVMPKWQKAPPDLVETFEVLTSRFPEAELKKMFGYPAAFVNGNMALGLWQETCILKLSPADLADFLSLPGATRFEPMKGRPMKEYGQMPESLLASEPEFLRWIKKSLDYVSSLPPKPKKK